MTTIVDRLLIKLGWLPMPLANQSPVIPLAPAEDTKTLDQLRDIPRYPPFMEGLPIYSPATLLATQKELIDGVRQIIANESLLNEHYMPAMMQLAALVQLLPASQAHHHRGAGGMLRHSLEVGLWALQQTEGKLIRGVVKPQQRRIIEPRWKLTVFLAGICHDLGKIITDISVTNRANDLRWEPYDQGLYEWANENKISNYFLHWQEGRGKKHTNVSSTMHHAVIRKETLKWINSGGSDAVIWLTESLNNNPGSTNQIHNFVVKADQLSVERDLKSMGVAMAGYEIGVPVERYLTDIMRRLVQEGIWRINEPSARIWNLDGTTYLVWPMAGEEIARRTKDEDIPGLPKTSDGILDMMVEREIAFLRDDASDPFYYISPDVITAKIPHMRMKAVRLRDQALISSMPIAPIPGKIHSSKSGSDSPDKKADAQAELPLNCQDDSSAPAERVESSGAPEIPTQSASSAPVERVPESAQKENGVQSNATLEAFPPPAEPEPAPAPAPAAPVTHKQLSLDELDGAMGELLRVLVAEFKEGKKSFESLGVKQADGTVYLKWPETFSGYGFTGKQILDELTELGWLIPASDVAKVGNTEFADGVSHSIKLSPTVGHLFSASGSKAFESISRGLNEAIEHAKSQKPTPVTSSFEEVFQIADAGQPAQPAKKPRKRTSKKKAEKQESSEAATAPAVTKSGCQLSIMLNQPSKGKSIVTRE
jgi:conjugal transfer pilus assembly protein TraI